MIDYAQATANFLQRGALNSDMFEPYPPNKNGRSSGFNSNSSCNNSTNNILIAEKLNNLFLLDLFANEIIDLTQTENQNLAIYILRKAQKNQFETEFLMKIIENIDLFKQNPDLQAACSKTILNNLKHEYFQKNQVIFNLGDDGGSYYIVLKGTVNCLVPYKNIEANKPNAQNNGITNNFSSAVAATSYNGNHEKEEDDEEEEDEQEFISKKVATNKNRDETINTKTSPATQLEQEHLNNFPNMKIAKTYRSGGAFGEIALLTKEKRTATMVCIEDSHLMSLSREGFDSILGAFKEYIVRERVDFLQQFSFFRHIREAELLSLWHYMKEEVKSTKTLMYSENEPVSTLYFIRRGEVEISYLQQEENNNNRNTSNHNSVNAPSSQLTQINGSFRNNFGSLRHEKIQQKRKPLVLLGQNSYFGDREITLKRPKRVTQAHCVTESSILSIKKKKLFWFLKYHEQFRTFQHDMKAKAQWSNAQIGRSMQLLSLRKTHRSTAEDEPHEQKETKIHSFTLIPPSNSKPIMQHSSSQQQPFVLSPSSSLSQIIPIPNLPKMAATSTNDRITLNLKDQKFSNTNTTLNNNNATISNINNNNNYKNRCKSEVSGIIAKQQDLLNRPSNTTLETAEIPSSNSHHPTTSMISSSNYLSFRPKIPFLLTLDSEENTTNSFTSHHFNHNQHSHAIPSTGSQTTIRVQEIRKARLATGGTIVTESPSTTFKASISSCKNFRKKEINFDSLGSGYARPDSKEQTSYPYPGSYENYLTTQSFSMITDLFARSPKVHTASMNNQYSSSQVAQQKPLLSPSSSNAYLTRNSITTPTNSSTTATMNSNVVVPLGPSKVMNQIPSININPMNYSSIDAKNKSNQMSKSKCQLPSMLDKTYGNITNTSQQQQAQTNSNLIKEEKGIYSLHKEQLQNNRQKWVYSEEDENCILRRRKNSIKMNREIIKPSTATNATNSAQNIGSIFISQKNLNEKLIPQKTNMSINIVDQNIFKVPAQNNLTDCPLIPLSTPTTITHNQQNHQNIPVIAQAATASVAIRKNSQLSKKEIIQFSNGIIAHKPYMRGFGFNSPKEAKSISIIQSPPAANSKVHFGSTSQILFNTLGNESTPTSGIKPGFSGKKFRLSNSLANIPWKFQSVYDPK